MNDEESVNAGSYDAIELADGLGDDVVVNPFLESQPTNEFSVEAEELEAMPFNRRLLVLLGRLQLVALPLFCLQIMSYLCVVTDVIFVGRIGTTELAAMGLGGAWQSCVAFIAYNISTMGLYSMISQAHGRSDSHSKGLALQTALVVGALLALFPVGPLLWFSAEILSLANVTDSKLLHLLSVGGKISWPGIFMECLYRVFEASLTNQRFLMPCMAVQFAAMLLNILFNWFFIYVLEWGFFGSVLGTAITRLIRLVLIVIVFFSWRKIREHAWTPLSRQIVAPSVLWTFLSVSVPSGLAVTLEIAGFEGVSFLAASLGVLASGVHVTAFQVLVLAFFFIFGTTNAMTVVVGNFLGANKLAIARSYAIAGAICSGVVMALNCTIMVALRNQIPRLMSNDPAVVSGAAALLPFAALVHVSDSLNQIVASLCRAAGRNVGSTVAVIVGLLFVSLPVGWLLAFRTAELGLTGLWLGLACGAFTTFVIQSVVLWRVDWQQVVKEAQQQLK